MENRIIEELRRFGEVRENVSFTLLTSFRVGGACRCLIQPKDTKTLKELISFLKNEEVPYKVFGNGTNLLCSEADFDGVIIKLTDYFSHYTIDGEEICAESGCSIIALSNIAHNNSLSGLEFASGIPGTLGGCIFMNAGAYNSSMSNVIKEVTILNEEGEIEVLTNEQCEFSYRDSVFKRRNIVIISAVLKLEYGDKKVIGDLMASRREKRITSQPLDYPSAGSVFRNPENNASWKLVDGIGYRGKRYGDIAVSQKHSNFIINLGRGNADDINRLIEEIQDLVKKQYDIDLICEVEKFNW
ncbi:MAG: UDP-N-acetylmuramate dehydrogenase [Erysipelotrichaceae bacterium]|nr:UDP-N-acetylmuramate dehydrogenase [Erysipelotrichaceae bacterium]